MNLIIGIVVSILTAFFLFTIFRDTGVSMILNPDALLIIIGGTVVALFVGFPYKRLRDTCIDVIGTFKYKSDRDAVIKEILMVARIYRKANIRNVENKLKEIKDDFLRMGINLLINNHNSETIKSIMEREKEIRIVNYHLSQNILKTLARLTPSLGLAGTVISLIKMFRNLQSIDTIAPLLAVALMSTFYGVIISNLIMLPLCAKVKEKAIVSETLMDITIEGVIAINNMEHPLKIEEKLTGYNEVNNIIFSKEAHKPLSPGIQVELQKL